MHKRIQLLIRIMNDHPKVVELLDEIASLKEEQSGLYKLNSTNSQRIVSLIDANQVSQDTIKKLTNEYSYLIRNNELKAENKNLLTKATDAKELIGEKDRVIQVRID